MSIVPTSRPQMTKAEAEAILASYDQTKDYKLKILAVRGYYKKTMGNPVKNDVGIYDDAVLVVGPEEFATFNANTDPSVLRPGIATLIPGVHIYHKGMHHIGKPTAYPAFRPANPEERLPVLRDGKPDWGIAINIHRGSVNSTSSEGCQTIYPVQWDDFQPWVYGLLDKYEQKTFPYVLIER